MSALRSTIFIGKPRREPFPISHQAFDDALVSRFPDVRMRRTQGRRGTPQTSFNLDIAGELRSGLFVPEGSLVLNDGDGNSWADTISWFLAMIPGFQAEMMVEYAYPHSEAIPNGATPDDVAAIYEALVANAD